MSPKMLRALRSVPSRHSPHPECNCCRCGTTTSPVGLMCPRQQRSLCKIRYEKAFVIHPGDLTWVLDLRYILGAHKSGEGGGGGVVLYMAVDPLP